MHDLKLVWRFAFHTIVATLLFGLVGAAAALLHYYMDALAKLQLPELVIIVIKWTEYLLFAADLLCFILYVCRETWLLIVSIVRPHSHTS